MNYRDKKDHLQGRFKVRYPNAKQVYYKGRFKNNIPQKIVYFYPQGQKLRTEKYTREGTIHTVFYYRNGQVDLIGDASLVQNKDTFLYQWQGPWQKYDSMGIHLEEQTYLRGQLIWIRPIKKKTN
jgi:antitoxin component YwqK of YwqJK toxin-antitoxin module